MSKMNLLVHVLSAFTVWLSGIVGFISGSILVLAWLFDKVSPSYTLDIFMISVFMFVIAIIIVIANMLLLVNEI